MYNLLQTALYIFLYFCSFRYMD